MVAPRSGRGSCFPDCGCTCGEIRGDIDAVLKSEIRTSVTFAEIVTNHRGWYLDRQGFDDAPHMIEELGLDGVSGVYVLWRAKGYCSVHEREHLRAFYVGKGASIGHRLRSHRDEKQIGDGLATEISAWPCTNRVSKYLEQLFLDTFDFPMNHVENNGNISLCHHIEPAAWN